jgi:signal transduction histidine kinase
MPTRESVAKTIGLSSEASVALENERLQSELRARRAELRECRARVSETRESVRRGIERNLHDGIQQRLISVAMWLGLLESKLPTDPEAAKPIAREAREALTAALRELRELSQGLYPPVLIERGLTGALDELSDRAVLPTHLELSIDSRPPVDIEAAAYFVACEALTNAVKHAHAREVRIAVWRERVLLVVEVADNGIGGADPDGGSGLRGLTARVEALGGRLIVSSRRGRGTTVGAEIPCV